MLADVQKESPQWRQQRSGNPTEDWPLLQELSCKHPQLFWSAALKQLGIQFQTPPRSILSDDLQNPDAVQWLPGMLLHSLTVD